MKKLILTFAALLMLCLTVFAQGNMPGQSGTDNKAADGLKEYLRNHIRYPRAGRDSNITGVVFVGFKVNADKSISDIQIIKNLKYGFGTEVSRALQNYKMRPQMAALDAGDYTCAVKFGIEDDVPDAKQMLASRYLKNFLFEVSIEGYGVITHTDWIIDDFDIAPMFDQHLGKVKTMLISRYPAKGKTDSLEWQTSQTFDAQQHLLKTAFKRGKGWFDNQSYTYNAAGYKTSETTYRTNDKPIITNFKVDAEGRVIEIMSLGKNNADSTGNRTVIVYGKRGASKFEVRHMSYNDGYTVIFSKNNALGKPLESYEYTATINPEVKKLSRYNEDGIASEYTVTDPFIRLDSKLAYKYDAQGNQTEVEHFNSQGKLSYTDVYKFDDKHHQTEFTMVAANGEVKIRSTKAYDAHGNITEAVDPGKKATFTYSHFDKQGNWHNATWTFRGEAHNISRQITYYP